MTTTTAFRIRKPTASVNLPHNPSFEGTGGFTLTNTTGGGRVSTKQHSGRYSCQVTPTSGTGYVTLTTQTQTNEAHVFLVWVHGNPTKLTNGSTDITPTLAQVGARGWNRWLATFSASQSNGQTTCAVKSTSTIYVDDVLLYAGNPADGLLDYFDGDSGVGRRWLGGRFTSASRQLAIFKRQPVWDGGIIQNLDDGQTVICELVVGLGVYPVEAIKDVTARGQVIHREQLPQPRSAKLIFSFLSRSLQELTERRADWLRKVPIDHPFALLIDIGNTTVEGRFTYVRGMEGNFEGFQEKVPLELEAQDPNLYGLAHTYAALTASATPSASYVAAKEEGVWRGFSGGTGARGPARVVYTAPNGALYWGTESVSGTAYVQKWNGEAVSDVCSVTGSITAGPQINTLAVSPDGLTLYVGGDYTHMNGTSGFNGIGKVTLSSGTAAKVPSAGSGCSGGVVLCGEIDPTGTYWVVGGTFTSINGVSVSRFARMTLTGETWSAVSGGAFGAAVRTLKALLNGDYLVGGSFDASTGLAAPSAPSASSARVTSPTTGTLQAGAVYRYKLTILTAVGETEASSAGSVTITAGGPSGNDNAANVNWSSGGTGTTGYRLWRNEVTGTYPVTTSGTDYYLLKEFGAGTTSYQDLGLDTLDKSRLAPTVNASGHRTPRVAWYDASATAWKNWGIIGMAGGDVYTIDVLPDQLTAVVGGSMTACDGTVCGGVAYISSPDGAWLPLGQGVSGGVVNAVRRAHDGRIWAGGAFTAADGNTLATRLARFDGFPYGVWQHVDIIPAGTVYSLAARQPDEIIIGHASTITSAAAATLVSYPGTAVWRPQILIDGPGVLRSIACYETGDELLLTHTLATNEQVVIDTFARTAISNIAGDVLNKIRPGSSLDTFYIPSGGGTITAHLTGGGSLALSGKDANTGVDLPQ